ncbi:MAG: PadR family transcriptional regulator [Anaerolineae bacterium]|nr:PadR family transcriptional regulator [Anaerolineae bacterium]
MANERDLTTLEYVVLGLISLEPQSGYSIINYFSPRGIFSWNASPGSIYPILKRLENQEYLLGTLEAEHEARPRKVYNLTAPGGAVLDAWLREVPKMQPLFEQREIGLWRFTFMEGRLSVPEVMQWIDNYLDAIRAYDFGFRFYQSGTLEAGRELGLNTIHRQLLLEHTLIELNGLRTWLEMARARLVHHALQTGEHPAVSAED